VMAGPSVWPSKGLPCSTNWPPLGCGSTCRKNKLAPGVYDRYDDILEAWCDAWTDLIAIPARFASMTIRNCAKVS
jgi:hypothetical protein